MERLHSKIYQNQFVGNFAGDTSGDLRPRQTPGVLYSLIKPTPVSEPKLLAWSADLAHELGIENPDESDVNILAGNAIAPTMQPYAACYAGHQFGNWAGQLGDGRAITLGEWATENRTFELQLKGAGLTPYSRHADGRAVLRSSVREYLMSEAMHYLGVPTTRALSLTATGDPVLRDMFYDGRAAHEPGAIVMRVAPSFLRFGNFEMLAARNELDNLRQLVTWTIDKHYPHIVGQDRILAWFKEVVERTATLMVEWARVGFVHGVMNTDNMSILGLTIDYGPYSFLDDYDPDFTPNTTDLPGRRYAFGQQASIAYWNLGCLASALAPLFDSTDALVASLEAYVPLYWGKYYFMMGQKLGLDRVQDTDRPLIDRFEQTLAAIKPDMTIFYQCLQTVAASDNAVTDVESIFAPSLYKPLSEMAQEAIGTLVQMYQLRLAQNKCTKEESLEKMKGSNPRFILRNYLLHEAIQGLEQGNDALFVQLQAAIKEPYTDKFDNFYAKRPDWATQKAGCSMLSCSS